MDKRIFFCLLTTIFYQVQGSMKTLFFLKTYKFFILIFFACLPLVAQGAQKIEVLENWDKNASSAEIADLAQEEAFFQAVYNDAKEILPNGFKDKSKEALKEFLEDYMQDLVLSYSRQEQEAQENGLYLVLQISVDKNRLKKLLKDWGTYYTAHKTLEYQLFPKGFAAKDWDDLENMQNLSGVKQSDQAETKLYLSKIDKKNWQGKLRYKNKEWTREGSDLKEIWPELWSEYFSLTQVKQEITEALSLKIKGWASTEGVYAMDSVLKNWAADIDDLDLLYAEVRPQYISALWRLSTLDRSRLEKKISSFVTKRGLSFSLSKVENPQEQARNKAETNVK